MRKISLAIMLVFLSFSAAGISDFQLKDGFSGDLNAGETEKLVLSFENRESDSVPLVARLNVTSDKEMVGEEFSVEAAVNSENSESSEFEELACQELRNVQYSNYYGSKENQIIYSCFSSGNPMLSDSGNNLTVNITVNPATAPANFNFNLTAYSAIGETEEKEVARDQSSGSVIFDAEAISFESEEEVDFTAWSYGEVYSSPEDKEFLGGVDTVAAYSPQETSRCTAYQNVPGPYDNYVEDDGYWFDHLECSTEQAEANATLRIDYGSSINDTTVGIYSYGENGWEEIDYDLYSQEDSVVANITNFSAYAAFGNLEEGEETVSGPEEDDGSTDSSSSGGGGGGTFEDDTDGVDQGSGDTSNEDSSDQDSNSAPEASFSYERFEDSLTVAFNATESSDPDGDSLRYSWDLGDRETENEVTFNHAYDETGVYTVNLTVFDGNGGSDSEVETLNLTSEVDRTVPPGPEPEENEEATPTTGQFVTEPATAAGIATFIILLLFLAIYLRKDLIVKIRAVLPE